MNAPIKYPGSKWRIARWIISFFPEHHSYLEPFFGSGAVLSERCERYECPKKTKKEEHKCEST